MLIQANVSRLSRNLPARCGRDCLWRGFIRPPSASCIPAPPIVYCVLFSVGSLQASLRLPPLKRTCIRRAPRPTRVRGWTRPSKTWLLRATLSPGPCSLSRLFGPGETKPNLNDPGAKWASGAPGMCIFCSPGAQRPFSAPGNRFTRSKYAFFGQK